MIKKLFYVPLQSRNAVLVNTIEDVKISPEELGNCKLLELKVAAKTFKKIAIPFSI